MDADVVHLFGRQGYHEPLTIEVDVRGKRRWLSIVGARVRELKVHHFSAFCA
jgi:hypothetical protein